MARHLNRVIVLNVLNLTALKIFLIKSWTETNSQGVKTVEDHLCLSIKRVYIF